MEIYLFKVKDFTTVLVGQKNEKEECFFIQRGDGCIIHTYGFERIVWSKLVATVDVNDLPTSGEK
jgi:hypothetical protein